MNLTGSLSAQVAVVAGGGSLGRKAALALAKTGAKVVIAEYDLVSGSETSSLIQHEGGEGLFVRTDIRSQESVARLASLAHTAYRLVSILVNVLPCPVETGPASESASDCLEGLTLVSQVFLPELLAQRHSLVINLLDCSQEAHPQAYRSAWKALEGFSQSLNQHARPNIRIINLDSTQINQFIEIIGLHD